MNSTLKPWRGVGLAALLLAALSLSAPRAAAQSGGQLTPEQIEAIRERLSALRDSVAGRHSELNRSAGAVFRQAAQDPKRAVELYASCTKVVNFDREGRDEAAYKAWEAGQRDNFRDPRFQEGLVMQLRYLALSCDAAEAEDLSQVFPSLLSYVDSLAQLNDLPSPTLLQGVQGSVFARAYKLEELLARNRSWEMVPYDISGIYEKTILPYLRDRDPSRLMGAWDRRIEQQTRMAVFLSQMEEKGANRNARSAAEERGRQLQQGRTGGVIRDHAGTSFKEDTLPALQWGRWRDMALHVDAAQGINGMLGFLQDKVDHVKAADWLEDLSSVLGQLAGGSSSTPAAPAGE